MSLDVPSQPGLERPVVARAARGRRRAASAVARAAPWLPEWRESLGDVGAPRRGATGWRNRERA